jgi:hypothetical protein
LVPVVPSLSLVDNISFDVPSVSPPCVPYKKESSTKKIIFPAFDFPPPVTRVALARGDSLEHGSAITVLNSPQTINTPFKKQDWMSNKYLDSILSLPPGAHANKGLTGLKAATRIVSVEEIEDENNLCFNKKEKLDPTGPIFENVIPADWLQKGHFVCGTQGDEMDVKLQITTLDMQKLHSVTALLDTGCTGSSTDSNFVKRHGINTKKIYTPIPVYNVDGSHNLGGPITKYVELHVKIQDHLE